MAVPTDEVSLAGNRLELHREMTFDALIDGRRINGIIERLGAYLEDAISQF